MVRGFDLCPTLFVLQPLGKVGQQSTHGRPAGMSHGSQPVSNRAVYLYRSDAHTCQDTNLGYQGPQGARGWWRDWPTLSAAFAQGLCVGRLAPGSCGEVGSRADVTTATQPSTRSPSICDHDSACSGCSDLDAPGARMIEDGGEQVHLLGVQSIAAAPIAVALGALAVISGLFFLAHLGKELILIGRLRRRGIGTLGTVINHVPDGGALDQPVIRFTDRQGRRFEFERRIPSRKFVPVGEQFSVVYLSVQPSRSARLRSEANFRSLLPALLGLPIFLVTGILVLASPWMATVSIELAPMVSWQSPLVRSLTILLMGALPGLAILFYVGWKIRRLYILHRDGLGATGTVTRTIDGDGVELVIDFVDFKSRRIQFLSSKGPRRIGATVPVVYLRDCPHRAAVAPALRNATSLWLPVLAGVIFLSASVVGMRF